MQRRPSDADNVERYKNVNVGLWNEMTPVHERSDFYDVASFKAGRSTLMSIELDELGDISGRSLLHLQCHFGLDTMSWARLGARVTGVDFSDKAIDQARSLSQELGIDARFVLSNVYDLPDALDGQFDIVFTSYGVLNWLPDLGRWARTVAQFLKPGGIFYIAEFHPFANVLDDEDDATEPALRYSYFHASEPMKFDAGGPSYADQSSTLTHPSYEWDHSMSDIVNSLVGAGLRIDFMHEFDYCCYQAFPFMEQGDDGWWRLTKGGDSIPLTFSITATKA